MTFSDENGGELSMVDHGRRFWGVVGGGWLWVVVVVIIDGHIKNMDGGCEWSKRL